MDGNGREYSLSEGKKFKSDLAIICAEMHVGLERIDIIVNVIRFAALRNPNYLPSVPGHDDMKFVFTNRVRRDGLQIPALRTLIKVNEEEKKVELLAATSMDVRL